MSQQTSAPDPAPAPPTVHAAARVSPAAPAHAGTGGEPARGGGLKWMIGGIVLVLVIAGVIWWAARSWGIVSTDDAYVNGHVTFVAPRVPGQVARVLVDDNNRVHKGDVLVQLDREPYLVRAQIAQSAVAAAQTDLQAALAQARAFTAQGRSARFNLENAIEEVDNRVALLRAKVATLQSQQASVNKAQADYDRGLPLLSTGGVSREEFDLRNEALLTAKANYEAALQDVYQVRVSLGLQAKPEQGNDLTQVPADLDQNFSTVREAQAEVIRAISQLGISDSYAKSPQQMVTDFYKRDPQGDIDRIYANLIREAPVVKQAQAKLAQTQRALDEALLDLKYCDVVAEIDGVVTRRNVNPGNNVIVGQSLMAIRSLTEIWVDANFKETQLSKIRIGQPVDLDVDMYGSHHLFKGRVSGFTMGTGSTLALLPAQNATGNFVKVVQRLPVRIDIVDYDPDKEPLFLGVSVEPRVHVDEQATGENAGAILQPFMPTTAPATLPESLMGPATLPDLPLDSALSGVSETTQPAAPIRPLPGMQFVPSTPGTQPGKQTMSAAALALGPLPVERRAVNPWMVAIAVVIPTFMEVLDTTIANVALRYIAGGLSSPVSQGEWVITSYLAANAIILPISGWLGTRLGRRNYFLLSIATFTLASFLCGIAPSLAALIAFRVLQGFAGGGLQPVSQAILLDAFPPAKHGAAMTVFGMAALIAPVVGPTLGGYITDNYGWEWIFYLNIPVGILALLLSRALVFDPPYLKAQQAAARKGSRFDAMGLTLLAATMVSWEVLLSKGQEWDWLGDPFYRIQTLLTIFLVCGGALVWREMTFSNPLINFRTLRFRNFRSACLIIFCAFAVLYANTTSLPGLLQSLFGYDATTSGLVLSPAGLFAVCVLLVVGKLMGRGVDARYFIGIGLVLLGAGNLWLSHLTLDISPWQVVWPRVVLIIGLSMIFAPLNVAAFQGIPVEIRGAAVGLLALLRNEGGSVGTSVAATVLDRREQFHTLRINEALDPFNPGTVDALQQGRALFLQAGGDPVASGQMALQTLANARDQQAASLAYFDIFWLSAVVAVALVVLVLLMKPAVAEKGAHLSAE